MEEKELLKEKILTALKEADFKKIADELIENSYPMFDQKNRQCGQMDGILVYDTEDETLKVVSEGKGTWTPSYVYLLRIDGDENFDALTEDELEDSWLCIYESLVDTYEKVESGEIFEYTRR